MKDPRRHFVLVVRTLAVGLGLVFLFGVLPRACKHMSVGKDPMYSDQAKQMADEIGRAKPGAIMVFRDGTLAHIEWAQGSWSGGNVSHNVFGGIHNLTFLQYLGHRVARVVNQDEPGYNDLARRYLAGGRVEPPPLPPR